MKERAAHVKEPATPSKSVARVPRVSPRPKEKRHFVSAVCPKMLAYILMSSVETTDKRLEVPSTAVMDMTGVSAHTLLSP